MIIYLGADHGGFKLKENVKEILKQQNFEIVDVGAEELVEEDDYPQYAWAVACKVAQSEQNRGILFCRSGAGMVIVANKKKGIRAVDVRTSEEARLAREKNDANVISIAGDFVKSSQIEDIVKVFLQTPFANGSRHQRRVEQKETIEKENIGIVIHLF